MKTFLVICAAIASVYGAENTKPFRAIAVVTGSNINGNVTFTQNGCGQPVLVEISLTGLTPGEHGFHVHEKGDISGGCLSLGPHFNPDKHDHGAPKDDVRHAGDLGNVRADASGIVRTVFSDNYLSLSGSRSVIGRGVIVHQDIDDLGKGGHPDSLKTGNAGARAACGIIGYLDEDVLPVCNSANIISSIMVPFLPLIVLLLSKWN